MNLKPLAATLTVLGATLSSAQVQAQAVTVPRGTAILTGQSVIHSELLISAAKFKVAGGVTANFRNVFIRIDRLDGLILGDPSVDINGDVEFSAEDLRMRIPIVLLSSGGGSVKQVSLQFSSGTLVSGEYVAPAGDLYTLSIQVTAAGETKPQIILRNMSMPATQEEFCNNAELGAQITQYATQQGIWRVKRCDFKGGMGGVDLELQIASGNVLTYSAGYYFYRE